MLSRQGLEFFHEVRLVGKPYLLYASLQRFLPRTFQDIDSDGGHDAKATRMIAPLTLDTSVSTDFNSVRLVGLK